MSAEFLKKDTNKQPFTLLVNSTDNYSDCWEPFFTLLAAYWPSFTGPIILNSETKAFTHKGLNIRTSLSAQATPGRHPTWTESLLFALDQAETDIVLYVQEDYFLKGPVDGNFLADIARLMEEKSVTYIGLMDEGNAGPFTASGLDERLCTVSQEDKYRISLQACLFSKSRFKKYFRKHENPWHFEYYGNVRARRKKDAFYTLDRAVFARGKREVFPYDLTGIISRQWKREIVEDLFARHGILVDFSIRGFIGETPPQRRYKRNGPTLQKLISTIKSLI